MCSSAGRAAGNLRACRLEVALGVVDVQLGGSDVQVPSQHHRLARLQALEVGSKLCVRARMRVCVCVRTRWRGPARHMTALGGRDHACPQQGRPRLRDRPPRPRCPHGAPRRLTPLAPTPVPLVDPVVQPLQALPAVGHVAVDLRWAGGPHQRCLAVPRAAAGVSGVLPGSRLPRAPPRPQPQPHTASPLTR